ncbi:lactococcin 972 family bacteriocin [Lysinibacillus sp. NPDC097214]|uniref:lactococcin 972 family bacteriocin n=1 Tax=Lysinibacillus sp. NPDC097214 TaxID=3390584 RepID=UPI003D00D815
MIKKSFRGIIAGLAVCTCLSVSAKGALAEELPTNGGGIDLDALIAQEETGSFLVDDTNNIVRKPVKAGGGTWEVIWGLDRHSSEYNHPSKAHMSAAGNWSTKRKSEWEAPGNLAYIWVKTSLWGNTAGWDTK